MEYIFELTQSSAEMLSYVGVWNDTWSVHGRSFVDYDRFVS